MAQPCKVFSYTNVSTEKNILTNLREAALAGNWSIDKDAIEEDEELYLHSPSRSLYFSMKLDTAADVPTRKHLLIHGNTGFNAGVAWNAQPGRFTERINVAVRTAANKAVWFYDSNKSDSGSTYDGGSLAWWVIPPVAEQLVLVCPSFILMALRVVQTRNNGSLLTGWAPVMFGASDPMGTAILANSGNMVLGSSWGSCASLGGMLSAHTVIPGSEGTHQRTSCITVGYLHEGQNVDLLPPQYSANSIYYKTTAPASVIRTSLFSTPTGAEVQCAASTTVSHDSETFAGTYKGSVTASVPVYDTAVMLNPGTLRSVLVKPLLYLCGGGTMRVVGELPYYAVNLSGLKAKDRISIGERHFLVLPNMHDSDTIGIALEVEAS